jgi:hypothetical protein
MLVLPLVRGSGPLRAAAPDEFRELTTAAEVRRLTAGQAAQRQPVRLRGVVTFFKENLYSRFIQDETAGIYLQLSTNTPQLEPGQLVEIEGTTSPGEYAPIIDPVRVRMLGEAPLPPAKPANSCPAARRTVSSSQCRVLYGPFSLTRACSII